MIEALNKQMPVKTVEESKVDVENINEQKIVELAFKNKSKKSPFTFKDMLMQLSDEEVDKMWEQFCQIIMKQYESILKNDNESPKKLYQEISQVIQAVIDTAHVMLAENIPIPKEFLHLVVFLNGILLSIPSHLESLKNNISYLCERMYSMNYIDKSEILVSNSLIYLLRRSTSPKAAKKDVKRIYPLRSLIPKILSMETVDSNEVWELLKKCASSQLYPSSAHEGQKILSLALTLDVDHIADIHNAIKKRLSSCSLAHAAFFGKVYYEAWSHAVKTESLDLKNAIEITCIQDLVLLAVTDRRKSIVLSTQKVLAQFHCKKKDIDVLKMLYSLYHPILWLHLKNPDGLIRANAAQLFLAVFPLENPDLDLVSSDQELNDQMLMIKELLVDDYPIVRCSAIVGLCLAMSVHWELFPEEMLKTYFKILVQDLSCDSSSSDVRCAVAKGFKGLLENPLTVPTLQNILPKLKNLFDDISSLVRVAFCQLLLCVKRIWGIRYYDIVPLSHLLARMEEDPAVSKLIVNLIHNSYFPKNEHPNVWMCRCAEMIKSNRESSREFFRHIPRYIGVDAGAKFMVQVVKAIHFYAKSKTSSVMNASQTSAQRKSASQNSAQRKTASQKKSVQKKTQSQKKSASRKRNNSSYLNESGDAEALESAIGFQDPNIVSGLLDAVSVLWLSCNLAKPENKNQLKMVVGNLAKWMEDLVIHYKDTPVCSSVFYLASLMPPENVPSLVEFCHEQLRAASSNGLEEDYFTLLQCLCNQREGGTLLATLKELIEVEFQKTIIQAPTPKRRKKSNNTSSILGLELVNEILNTRACQKIILAQHSEELKSFLELFNHLKVKIEALLTAEISEQEADFVLSLLLALSKISMLLQSENFNGVKFMEDIVIWVQNKLCKQVWPQTDNSRRSSMVKKVVCSSQVKKLVANISREIILILADVIYLGYFNEKCRFIKFGVQLLNLDLGASILLPLSKMFLRHVWSGVYLYCTEKKETALQITPDCINKINEFSSSQEIISRIPNSALKEIQLNMNESIKLLKKCNRSYSRLSFAVPSLKVESEKPMKNEPTENNVLNNPHNISVPLLDVSSGKSKDRKSTYTRKSKRLSFAVPLSAAEPDASSSNGNYMQINSAVPLLNSNSEQSSDKEQDENCEPFIPS
ncbi:condensin-2 complex subunit G2 isoform X1 [Parasteatoda tepidariorum]|uniref:condensin-2 complex subunit G2 isoform X1 n=2 Tax=Parasteatoda tepidariorum TaxID=114398 RepID=UPI00077F8A19|nr:condensin-2 complex subunit G2 isoform X1 [Parasteatoda tepidariorum]